MAHASGRGFAVRVIIIPLRTKDAVFSGPPIYSTSDVETTGGELTFDYRASNAWNLQGGYSYSRGKKDGLLQNDFPSPWRV